MRFRGHESFFLRQGWLTKAMNSIIDNNRVFFEDKETQTDALGIGSNMVKALRYWIEAFDIAKVNRSNNTHEFTEFGDVLWKNDRYIQNDITLWMLHYKLATGLELSTSWYWLFNEFDVNEFTEEEFIQNLMFYANKEAKIAESSIKGDMKCIDKTYLSERDELESNIYCPLSDLKLLTRNENRKNTFIINNKSNEIPSNLLFYIILDQYEQGNYLNKSKEINIERLHNDRRNIGKVFRLKWNNINEHLDILQKQGYIDIIRTSGLDVIRIKYNGDSITYLNEIYLK